MYNEKKIAVIIAAAGSGKRMGSSIPKQFLNIDGKPILALTALAFSQNSFVDGFFVVTGKEYLQKAEEILGGMNKYICTVEGGQERQDSVYNGIKMLENKYDYVLIHDAARPFVSQDVINRVIQKMVDKGNAVAAVPVKDTIKTANEDDTIGKTLKRLELRSIQTPQGFRVKELRQAYERAFLENYYGTDDAVLLERMGQTVHLVLGDYNNIKITTKEDMPMECRIGTGFDVHKFEEGRKLILGGEEIPYEKGLLGHSDADVLSHAIMDALLGAAALGDIGKHFPDTDPAYKGISSLKLLEHVGSFLEKEGYTIGNIDATVIAQEPKLLPFIKNMQINVADALKISHNKVNVKATTTEKLGFTGRKEGIAAEAVCLLNK